jgi:hypothetical protein
LWVDSTLIPNHAQLYKAPSQDASKVMSWAGKTS